MNQSFKINQLLKVVDDAKSPDVKPQVQVAAPDSKVTTTAAQPTATKDLPHVAESGLVQRPGARA